MGGGKMTILQYIMINIVISSVQETFKMIITYIIFPE